MAYTIYWGLQKADQPAVLLFRILSYTLISQSANLHDYENSLATRNLTLVKLIVPLGYVYDFSSYNSLSVNVKNVTEVSFFFNNPSAGFFKALNQIGQRWDYKPASGLQGSRYLNLKLKAKTDL